MGVTAHFDEIFTCETHDCDHNSCEEKPSTDDLDMSIWAYARAAKFLPPTTIYPFKMKYWSSTNYWHIEGSVSYEIDDLLCLLETILDSVNNVLSKDKDNFDAKNLEDVLRRTMDGLNEALENGHSRVDIS